MLGYTFCHQLFIYSCNSWLFIFIHVVIQLSFSSAICLSCYLSYLMYADYLVIILCTLFICTSSPLYTHSLGRFLTTLDLHVQILDADSIVQMYDETVRLARNQTLSFDSGILSFLYSCYYSLIPVYHHWLLFCSLFHSRSCVASICIIAVIADYYDWIYSLFKLI